MKSLRFILAAALILITCAASSKAIYMSGKAWLAQILLLDAWHENMKSKERNKPWPWADIYPVALLEVPRLKIQQVVLNDHSGQAMAFGPGMISTEGGIVLAGHRDSHFEYLQELKTDDQLILSSRNGDKSHYRVTEKQIINTNATKEIRPRNNMLVLTTCYPFDANQAGGPLRYLVIAEKVHITEITTSTEMTRPTEKTLARQELNSQTGTQYFRF